MNSTEARFRCFNTTMDITVLTLILTPKVLHWISNAQKQLHSLHEWGGVDPTFRYKTVVMGAVSYTPAQRENAT